MTFDIVFLNARFDDGAIHHVAVDGGLIAAITPAACRSAQGPIS